MERSIEGQRLQAFVVIFGSYRLVHRGRLADAMHVLRQNSYYEDLDIKRTASDAEIREACAARVSAACGDPGALKRIAAVQAVLTSRCEKVDYDRSLLAYTVLKIGEHFDSLVTSDDKEAFRRELTSTAGGARMRISFDKDLFKHAHQCSIFGCECGVEVPPA